VPPPRKRYNNILSNNFRKLKRIVVIFAKQHQLSKEKLTVERKSTSTNECCYFTLQNETLSKPLHNNTKKGQNSTKKARNLLVHIVELSLAVEKS